MMVVNNIHRDYVVAMTRFQYCFCVFKALQSEVHSPVDGFASTYAVLKTLSPLFSIAAVQREGPRQVRARVQIHAHTTLYHILRPPSRCPLRYSN